MPGVDPLESLRLVRKLRPELPVIFVSGTIGEDLATQTLKMGANDYVLKQRMDRLEPTVRRALAEMAELARRRQAEDSLRSSEERMRLAQEVAKIGAFERNFQTGVSTWSPELEPLYGLPRGGFGGTMGAWLERVHPDDQGLAKTAVEKAMVSGHLEAEWRAKWPDGTIRWLAVRGHVFMDEAGKPLRLVGVNIDITERKRAEEALLSAKHSAEGAKEAAEQANRAKDHFLAILSHELRTPLTAVLPALDALRESMPESSREFLDLAARNVELEARLIDDLLDITRIARGKVELHRKPVDVCAIMQHAVDVGRSDMEQRGLHFAVRFEEAPHMVMGDAIRLEQVFWNLLQNAVKFTPRGGCIGVRVYRRGATVIIEVHDSGTGIDHEAMTRIFNAFEQETKSTTRAFGGLGLGLAISKTMVEMHGGTIRAQSDGKGKGAVFVVELPLLTADEQVAGTGPHDDDAESGNIGPLRVLLVEDHADTARILGVLLSKAGHHVQHAGDVASAYRLAMENKFDMLVSDLGLPDGSGHDLMIQLNGAGRSLPAIALSGYGTPSDIERSLASGFIEHVVKPVSFRTLLAAIARVRKRAMRQSGAAQPE